MHIVIAPYKDETAGGRRRAAMWITDPVEKIAVAAETDASLPRMLPHAVLPCAHHTAPRARQRGRNVLRCCSIF